MPHTGPKDVCIGTAPKKNRGWNGADLRSTLDTLDNLDFLDHLGSYAFTA